MALQSVKVWRDEKRNLARVYAKAEDGREGVYYIKAEGSGRYAKAAKTTEGKLTEEEWAEARAKGFNEATKRWESWYSTPLPQWNTQRQYRCPDCGGPIEDCGGGNCSANHPNRY